MVSCGGARHTTINIKTRVEVIIVFLFLRVIPGSPYRYLLPGTRYSSKQFLILYVCIELQTNPTRDTRHTINDTPHTTTTLRNLMFGEPEGGKGCYWSRRWRGSTWYVVYVRNTGTIASTSLRYHRYTWSTTAEHTRNYSAT